MYACSVQCKQNKIYYFKYNYSTKNIINVYMSASIGGPHYFIIFVYIFY